MNTKIFIGPMSKNIVDSVIELSNDMNVGIGLIASRRQIEYNGGYVNNWTTNDFSNYVRSKTKNVILVRDHCGPNQGLFDDDGTVSFYNDCQNFDVIHIDVWKKYSELEDGIDKTIEFINTGYEINKNITYEVGTEESIRKFDERELYYMLNQLQKKLHKDIFKKIKYCVIQSGTALKETKNIGVYDSERLKKMVNIVKNFNMISKEHNGDFITKEILKEKFFVGLDTINIAPEFGQFETKIILDELKKIDNSLIFDLFNICYKSKKWEKWVDSTFIPENNKEDLIIICGHYLFSNDEFIKITEKLDEDILIKIKNNIKIKLMNYIR
jgi:hypothetical protein